MKGAKFDQLKCQHGNTLRDPVTGQSMHSAIGPTPEAVQIYLDPSSLEERLQTPGAPLVLWDVGMGIAGNAAAALAIQGLRPLELHSFENDLRGIHQAMQELTAFPHLKAFETSLNELLAHGRTQVSEHQWILHEGDFRETLHHAPPAEVIFLDFYSPKAVGELWATSIMAAIAAASPQATLVTYSAATPVRLALLLSGWWVGRPDPGTPVTALKNESTIAIASPEQTRWLPQRLGSEWIDKFRSSSQGKPYGPPGDRWANASFEEIEAALLKHPQFQR